MKTLKLDQFEKFECNISQMEKIKGGENETCKDGVYTGEGIDARTGNTVKDWCCGNGELIYW